MTPVDPRRIMALENKYQFKRTAEAKPCFICGRSAEQVLDAADDFFYICASHVKDPGFCTPIYLAKTDDAKEPAISHYQLHRSILYLRQQRWEEKKRWSLLKKLPK